MQHNGIFIVVSRQKLHCMHNFLQIIAQLLIIEADQSLGEELILLCTPVYPFNLVRVRLEPTLAATVTPLYFAHYTFRFADSPHPLFKSTALCVSPNLFSRCYTTHQSISLLLTPPFFFFPSHHLTHFHHAVIRSSRPTPFYSHQEKGRAPCCRSTTSIFPPSAQEAKACPQSTTRCKSISFC